MRRLAPMHPLAPKIYLVAAARGTELWASDTMNGIAPGLKTAGSAAGSKRCEERLPSTRWISLSIVGPPESTVLFSISVENRTNQRGTLRARITFASGYRKRLRPESH